MRIIRLTLLMTLAFVLPVLAIRAQPYDDHGVRGVLTETQNCPPTCMMGLQPGHTTLDSALSELYAHNWVGDVRFQYANNLLDGSLQWTWSGQQPAFINARQPGTAQFRAGVISYVTLPTQAELWQFLLLNGQPDTGRFMLIRNQSQHALFHRARYANNNLTLLANRVACPLSSTALYRSGIVLEVFETAGTLGADQPGFQYGAVRLLRQRLDC